VLQEAQVRNITIELVDKVSSVGINPVYNADYFTGYMDVDITAGALSFRLRIKREELDVLMTMLDAQHKSSKERRHTI
jgi:hypothetical protein